MTAAEHETAESICAWATETFEMPGTDFHVGIGTETHASVRLMEAVAALVTVVVEFESWDVDPETMMASAPHREAIDRIHPKMRDAAADVAIVLTWVLRRVGGPTLNVARTGSGSGWHPYAHQAALLNGLTARLIRAIHGRETYRNRLAAEYAVVLPDIRASLAANTNTAEHDLLAASIAAFEALTHDLNLQAAIDARMRTNRTCKWIVAAGHAVSVEGT